MKISGGKLNTLVQLNLTAATVVALAGAVVVHSLVMFVDYLTLEGQPLHVNMQHDFIGALLSPAMMPMAGAYGLLTFVVYALWRRSQRAEAQARLHELKLAEQR